MITTLAVLAGALLLVLGVYGLAGPWWACLLAGALLIAWAFLDELGRRGEATKEQQP